jgi:predicted TIM-barrel fold metal-dependent hydrolase
MQQATATGADRLLEPWFTALRERLPGLRMFDCHTHLGCADPDGSCFADDELRAALEVVDARAVVFPLAEPGSYHEANNRMLAAAAAADGRLIPFCRVDPRNGGLAEAHRAVERGARGIKLHPRAERFGLADPLARDVFAFASKRRLPVIVHAGRGIPSLGRDALELARAFPEASIILAHAAISDLSWIWHEASRQRNLFFDTAWWNTADQLALFELVAPGQILFASDTPYGRTVSAATVVLRAALAAGLSDEQVIAVAGGQLERLLAGADPLDLGPSPIKPAPSPGPLLERIHTLLVAAAARLTAGYPAEEYLSLARLACRLPAGHPDTTVADSVLELLDRHTDYLASDPPRRGPRVSGIHLIFAAAAVARTPGVPVP